MGCLFKRKQNGVESPIWQMKYRVYDVAAGAWGAYRYESSETANRREAEALLRERETKEERKRLGIEPSLTGVKLGRALTSFLDETQVFDRAVPERNRTAVHPVLGIEVKGTAWWARTVEFAAQVLLHFGDVELAELARVGAIAAFDRYLANKGGARGQGVGPSTRHKVLTWFGRFCRWAVVHGHLAANPLDGYAIPAERVERRDRILDQAEEATFWAEYEALPLKAKVRVGLALWTGARSGEVETIRVSDVALQFGTVRRRLWKKSRSDSAKEAVVRVPPELLAVVGRWIEVRKLEAGDRLLPIRCQAGGKFLRRWATSMRGLRRTVLTRLQDAGVPLRVIQETAGHAKLDTTQRYLGVGESAVNTALSSLSWGRAGANTNANTARHQATTERDLTRQDEVERLVDDGSPSRG